MTHSAARPVFTGALCFLSLLLTAPANSLPPGSGVLYFVHNDANGTPQALTDEAGKVVWKAQTDPFGSAVVDNDPDGDGQAVEFNVRAPGQYRDRETGLHYNYARYYDPEIGRYIRSDPMGLRAGLNTYAYASSNPIIKYDYFGLAEICNVGIPFSLGVPHTFLCANGECGGKHSGGAGPALYSQTSQIRDDLPDKPAASCSDVPEKNCDPVSLDECVAGKLRARKLNEPYFFSGSNCGTWAINTILECRRTCRKKQP